MKRKIILSLFCLVLLFATCAVPIGAVDDDYGIMPLWDNTSAINCALTFDKNDGYAEGFVQAEFGTSAIKIDVFVYKQIGLKWIYVGQRHVACTNDLVLGISHLFTAEMGMKYKADFTFTVTKDGVDEVITRTETRAY